MGDVISVKTLLESCTPYLFFLKKHTYVIRRPLNYQRLRVIGPVRTKETQIRY